MALWRQLRTGVRALLDRASRDQEITDEVDAYFAEAVAELEARGLSGTAARRRTRMEFGDHGLARETVRSYGWENGVERVAADVRYAARRLRRNPGFTALAVLTLGLGIGAATTIFSVTRPILFDPLPYPEADRLVAISDRSSDGSPIDVTFGTYVELTERSRSFAALAVSRPWQPTLTGAARPERLSGQRVSGTYFRVLGIQPMLGRAFEPGEDQAAGPDVVILSYGLWQQRFGGDTAIIGHSVRLDGEPFTVVGVLGADFENVLAPEADVWAPLQFDASLPSFQSREWGHQLRLTGRLRPGVGPEDAAAELARIGGDPVAAFPRPAWASLEGGLLVSPLKDEVTRAARPALLAILGAVLLLLVTASMNVTHLLLGRSVQRRAEFAMRAALGARRRRMLQQLLTESLLLAALGGLAGVGLAMVGVRTLVGLSPPELPRLGAVRVDGVVCAVAFAVTALVGVLAGLLPALQASSGPPRRGLRETARQTDRGQHTARNVLVVAEVSLTLVLLIGAGLLLRSMDHLLAVDPGFDGSDVVTMQVQTSGARYADDGATHRFFAEALRAVRGVPGVETAAVTSQLPLSGEADEYGVHAESNGELEPEAGGNVLRYAVSPGYFSALGIPLRQGRTLEAGDDADAPPVAVVSASMARRRFPGRDPVGQRIHIGRTDLPWYTIVGVVGDVKQVSLSAGEADAVYVTPEQWYFADKAMWLVVRARGDAAGLAPRLERAIWSVDPDRPIVRVATVAGLVAASAAERRFALRVFEAFALAALLLAAVGLYGVLAEGVAERTREIGVRAALGATGASVVWLVVRQGMTLAAVGAGLGLLGGAALSRALDSLLFGVSAMDPVTYLGVLAVLAAIAAAACAAPAWRASRIEPATAIRAE